MKYEIITVHEYNGNNFDCSREAKLYENGTLEYLPLPDYEEEDLTDTKCGEEEDEEQCMMTS